MFTTLNRSCRTTLFNFISQRTRTFSSKSCNKTLVWVHGASSNIANAIKTAAITKNHSVISAQRTTGYAETTKHRYVKLLSHPNKPEKDAIYNTNELLKQFNENILVQDIFQATLD